MGEIMTPIPFEKLIGWMKSEYNHYGSVFCIDKRKFYRNTSGKAASMLGSEISSPIGPAAGPNTQLAQNLVAAYVSGFRFMELKTVQTMDGEDLRKCIPRPCIKAEDEGYNVEWSTELSVQQAYEEYIKGWFALHVAAKEFGLSDQPDVLFNMSVGYDFEGITSKKIDTYIENMRNASGTDIWGQCKSYLLDNITSFERMTAEDVEAISPCVSASITLSTLHGCPPEEIEKIAHYFLTEKNMHTYVKVNPTLLGYDFVRNILDDMGYTYIAFDTTHFDQDLKMDDAVKLLKRLMATSEDKNLSFGVKVSNTFPVMIANDELPGEFMYMSGRSLFPLSVNVALKLSEYFDGKLPISYSGGADYFNIEKLLRTGIKPITVATTILKPGGYARGKQLCEAAKSVMSEIPQDVDVDALRSLAQSAKCDAHHVKEAREVGSRKTETKLELWDCFKAPCKDGGCPVEQQIPEYLELVNEGRYDEAFKVIAIDNAMPAITSEICDHQCQNKCTRLDYETPIQIRNAKRIAVQNAQRSYINNMTVAELKTDKKAVVIGAGPGGIAAALFLRRNGMDVTVREKREKPMGIVQAIIPEFRIPQAIIDLDVAMAEKAGVKFMYGVDESYDVKKLREEYDYVIIATGTWKEGYCPVKEGGEHLVDALDFLLASKQAGCKLDLGKRVAVIGGGDVAMDCSRAAKRASGVEVVDVVYRRTQAQMPAEYEEQQLALGDGVRFVELCSPVNYDGENLTVEAMRLGERGADGRRKTLPTGETKTLQYDTIISAIGARVDTTLFEKNNITLNECGYAALNENYQTNIDGVYIAGDCRGGAATIIRAVADSKKIAKDILNNCGIEHDFVRVSTDIKDDEIRDRKAVLCDSSCEAQDCARCLKCDEICEICTEVCPNRANVVVVADGKPQIVHIDGMCNECGNCAVFCPHRGDPAKDKLTLFWHREGFEDSKNTGFMFLGSGDVLVRNADGTEIACAIEDGQIDERFRQVIEAVSKEYSYMVL